MIHQLEIWALLDKVKAYERKAVKELWKANQGGWPEMITHWTAKRNVYRKYRKAIEKLLNR